MGRNALSVAAPRLPGGAAVVRRGGRGRVSPGHRGRAAGATRRVAVVDQPRRAPVWINRLLILLSAAVVLAAGAYAWHSLQRIPVQQITVKGELEHTRREAVQAMVQSALAGGFMNADLGRIRRQLEGLPWIYRATVRRQWPAALEIEVVEQLPIARWGESGYLNHEGELFSPARQEEWGELPLLQGPEGAARALMGTYRRMADIVSPMGIGIEQLRVDERGQVEAVLSGGIRLLLGSGEFLERMHRFVSLYRREPGLRTAEVERVDLRYGSGVAVAFREPDAVAAR